MELVTWPRGQLISLHDDDDDDPVWTQRTAELRRPALPSEVTLPRPTRGPLQALPPVCAPPRPVAQGRPRLASVPRLVSSSPPRPAAPAPRARLSTLPPVPTVPRGRVEYFPPQPVVPRFVQREPKIELERPRVRAPHRPRLPTIRNVTITEVVDDLAPEPAHSLVPWIASPAVTAPAPAQRRFGLAWLREPWLALLVCVSLFSIVLLGAVGLSASAQAPSASLSRVISAAGPDGAVTRGDVFINGVMYCSELPCVLNLEAGKHWVRVLVPGYTAPPTLELDTRSNLEPRVHFALQREAPEPLRVVGQQAPAEPELLVAPSATEPESEPSLSEAAPVRRYEVATSPAPQLARTVSPRYAPAARAPQGTARLNINSVPSSNIVLNGRPIGQTPKLGVQVAPGPQTVVFVRGSKRVVRSTVARAGETSIVASRL